ncbi:MAG: dihydroorotase [Clostridiales bacterium]|nr:dihydroorotase [Clostridiales bacterium]
MKSILIKGGEIVDSAKDRVFKADLLIKDGRIVDIRENLNVNADVQIDATGLFIMPGLVDMHVHLRDPGQTHKEDIHSGCMAAAAGGFTAVACMPNTNPVVDSPELVSYITDKAKAAAAKVYPIASATRAQMGEEICDYALLRKAGAIAISDDGVPVKNAAIMQSAMESAAKAGITIISHCEDMGIIGDGIMHKGIVSEELGVSGMDRTSEDSITAREIAIAAATDTSIHIAHVSTSGSVSLIRDAKARGVKVTAETCPHYLIFTHEELRARDADFRMNPPLREQSDKVALIGGICDGTIDCIVTDHAPHTKTEKADFQLAPNGVVGLETSLAAVLTVLFHGGKLSLPQIARIMSTSPCEILGIDGGKIEIGGIADLTIINPNLEWEVSADKLKSKSKNTPFKGRKLKGKAIYTICDGKITYKYER